MNDAWTTALFKSIEDKDGFSSLNRFLVIMTIAISDVYSQPYMSAYTLSYPPAINSVLDVIHERHSLQHILYGVLWDYWVYLSGQKILLIIWHSLELTSLWYGYYDNKISLLWSLCQQDCLKCWWNNIGKRLYNILWKISNQQNKNYNFYLKRK